jgi:hypothetical protein
MGVQHGKGQAVAFSQALQGFLDIGLGYAMQLQ